MRKKAVSHIEMAISFGMFTVFVFFLIFYLRPVRNQNIGEVLIDAIEAGLRDNASLQLVEIPLILSDVASGCFKIPKPFLTSNTANMFVRNYSEGVLRFDFEGDYIKIEKSGIFYYLYYANATFNTPFPGALPCPLLNLTEYKYAAARTSELYFYPSLQKLEQDYNNDYEMLKTRFNFPSMVDFLVNVTDMTSKITIISMFRKKPAGVEVNARDLPIEILNADGTTSKAILNIQVW